MKFAAAALLGLASATSEQGIAMLQKLNSLPQDLVDMDDVKTALVECSVAGDCSAEAAAMPHLALAAEESPIPSATTTDATGATTGSSTDTTTTDSTTTATKQTALQKWEACVDAHGDKACAKEREAAFNKDAVAHA